MIKLYSDSELRKVLGESWRQRVLEKSEQKVLWQAMVENRQTLLEKAGR
jgi:hypothetical protein